MKLDLRPLEACSWVALIVSWFFNEPNQCVEQVHQGTFAIVAIVGAAVAVTAMTAKAADGAISAHKANKKAEEARDELDKQQNMFAQLDTSNPYLGMENTMEDLTVNQQAADFTKQQQMQSQANIMQQMRGSAGGSGIAALAQTLASQGSMDAQKASASIAQQESANQLAAAKEAGSIQQQEIQGELQSRQMESDKLQTMMGQTHEELRYQEHLARKGKEEAFDSMAEAGTTTMNFASGAGGGAGGAAGGAGGAAGGAGSDRRLKKDIKEIGRSPSGLNIYSFKYIDKSFGEGTWQGVMSDEIPQYAVIKHKDGYDRVDYSKLDVEFKQV